jgi:hypothetical protein
VSGGITVRVGTDADTEAIAQLYADVFGEISPARLRWLHQVPSGNVRRLLAVEGDRLAGHMAAIGLPAYFDGTPGMTGSAVHWMVHPDFRGRGVGRAMTDVDDPEWVDVVVTFAVDSVIPVLEAAYPDYTPIGRVPAWLAWRHPDAVSTSKLPRGIVTAGVRLAAGAGRIGRQRGLRLTRGLPDDAALDDLARRSAGFARCIRRRDAAHVRWRWAEESYRWEFVSAHDRKGRLRGWAVYGSPEHENVGVIIDVLVDSPHALRSLVSFAADDLARGGAEMVLLRLLDPRRWVAPALLAAGFLRRGEGPYVVTHQQRPDFGEGCTERASWYLTAGDADRL